jgi:hypothetical protein
MTLVVTPLDDTPWEWCDIIIGMGALPTLVSVDEYLHTVYEPDCDYVHGVTLERNAGEKDHSKAQLAILLYLWERRKRWSLFVIQA